MIILCSLALHGRQEGLELKLMLELQFCEKCNSAKLLTAPHLSQHLPSTT